MVVGKRRGARSERAWLQAYRGVNHRLAFDMLTRQVGPLAFPPEIVRFGLTFKILQEKRHEADYDPSSTFRKADVAALIDDAERAIASFLAAPPRNRRALAILVLLGRPRP